MLLGEMDPWCGSVWCKQLLERHVLFPFSVCLLHIHDVANGCVEDVKITRICYVLLAVSVSELMSTAYYELAILAVHLPHRSVAL